MTGPSTQALKHLVGELEDDARFTDECAHYRYLPPREARYGELATDPRLAEVLAARGVERFFHHQAEGVAAVRRGEHVVAMTPTASGKSLIYNIPVLEAALNEPGARALYVFPLKGLEQDQVGGLNELLGALGLHPEAGAREKGTGGDEDLAGAEVYDGDTPQHRRGKIRAAPPSAVLTNPDMLHLALLPHHRGWAELFRNLRYVVIDEIHTYRGVFGSHAAQIFRRLRRIARHYGADPQFIACSATIANPAELATSLTGVPFTAVTESGAPAAGKHFYFVNPTDSPYTAGTRLLLRCLEHGLKTIAFTRSRKATELIYRWAGERDPALGKRISPYRAGLLPSERREIEQRLFSGELSGVVSTSALELGVDVGGLDACVLAGYPGSIASTWQRAGRVGRRGGEALIFLIGQDDALDQYFMRHPEDFFDRPHEAVVVDPANPRLLAQHLPCAAAEAPLAPGEPEYAGLGANEPVAAATEAGELRWDGRDGVWRPGLPQPQREVDIRAIGEGFAIFDPEGKKLGELDGERVHREAFPGAVYLHRGRYYRVLELDLAGQRVVAQPEPVDYYTRALTREETTILAERGQRQGQRLSVHFGDLRTTQQVTGYEVRRNRDGKRLDRHELELPETTFDTEGLWLPVTGAASAAVEAAGADLPGALHAAEHAAIKLLPLYALCDKNDLGGVSYPSYPPLGGPAIFIYDGHAGGVGFSRRGYAVLGHWLAATLHALRECPCTGGCPSCIQDPQCGNANEPLDKRGAMALLAYWLGEGKQGEPDKAARRPAR